MIDIETKIAAINAQIQKLSTKKNLLGNPVILVAVSKKQPVSAIRSASAIGQKHFGENYVQEAVAKIREIDDKSLIWHFMGAIQSNKTVVIAEHFDWVHSIDRLKIARRLSEQRSTEKSPLNILIQVNIDADSAKAGVTPEASIDLAREIHALPNLCLRGFMALPANKLAQGGKFSIKQDESLSRQSFTKMYSLFKNAQAALNNESFNYLSMGMSGDFVVALEEGANIVRIGTAIFGPRSS